MKIFLKLTCLLLSIYCGLACATDQKEKIYLISSSSQYDEKIVPHIIKMFNDKGFAVDTKYLDQHVSEFGYVNTDANRAQMLLDALHDNQVKYLWFIRGGAGAFNLIPDLYANLSQIKKSNPKVFIGFSDVTAIHYFINKYLSWPSVHGVVAAYNKETYEMNHAENKDKTNMNSSVDEVFKAIKEGVAYEGLIPLNQAANQGVSGTLQGGNFTLTRSFFSTEYEKNLSDEILMLEGVGMSYRALDRALHQLLYRKSNPPKAIIFGQFFPLAATEKEQEIYRSVIKAFADKVPYPVFYYPHFGHGYSNNPFILAAPVTIQCDSSNHDCQLTQAKLVMK